MASRNSARPRSGWSAVRMWQQDLAQSLQRRHALRLHGWVIGSITLLVTWGVSHLQMAAGVESLALRYLVSLGAGYLAYLCVVRLWAAWLLGRRDDPWDGSADLADIATSIDWPAGGGPARMPMPPAVVAGTSPVPVPRVTLPARATACWAMWPVVPSRPPPAPTKAPSSLCPWWRSS